MSDQWNKALLDTPEFIYSSQSISSTIIKPQFPRNKESGLSERATAIVSFDLPTWNPDSLHWEAPSTAIFYDDGRVTLFVTRIANHRRHGIFNEGKTYIWSLDYSFLDEDQNPLHSSNLRLSELEFKKTENRASASATNSYLEDNACDLLP